MATLQKIQPHLWFDNQAEDAAKFYTSIFKNGRIGRISHYAEAGREIHGRPPGSVLTVEFEIEGQQFVALNGGPIFKFNESISFLINCQTQEEIDDYWVKLTDGGDPDAQQCGWLKDKFGVSWQVVPTMLAEIMSGNDKAVIERVMGAFMKMKKIDIAELDRAAQGK